MIVLKCKMCGSQLPVTDGQSTVQCDHCDSVQTIPKLDDELKLKMFERATELRLRCEFDQASIVFQNITTQFPDEAEAYWGLCLCKYGIEYVDDPNTLAKIPTCHRTYHQSILTDTNYLAACQYANASSKCKYEEEAQEIDRLQRKILDISRTEQPCDIFICYKENDDSTGARTNDSIAAQDIYTELVKTGYSVFYSRVSLRSKAGSEYEPMIYAALSSAKVMLVLGSQKEYFSAVWVKNEWSRFLDMMQSEKKLIVVCYENIKPETDLPVQLRNIQALDMGNKIFFNDLLSSIERIVPRKTQLNMHNNKPEDDLSATPHHKELNFDDGVYVGEALGNRPHGFGTRFFTNGNKYEGEWNMGNKHGNGTFTYSNGDSWTGEWNKDKAWNGRGKYYTHDLISVPGVTTFKIILNNCGDRKIEVISEIKKITGMRLAQAKSIAENTPAIILDGISKEEGERIKHSLESVGAKSTIEKATDESVPKEIITQHWKCKVCGYTSETASFLKKCPLCGAVITQDTKTSCEFCLEGVLKNGLLTGNGKLYLDNKLQEEGTFAEGKLSGDGLRYRNNSLSEKGTFENGKLNGQGEQYRNGEIICSGEWKNGRPWNAEGEYSLLDSDGKQIGEYKGKWIEGLPNGEGVANIFGKGQMVGIFNKGLTGTVNWKYNDKWLYKGTILDGSRSGRGQLFSQNGNLIYEGEFENEAASGHGIQYFRNNERYEGEFQNNKRNGQGTYYYSQGTWTGEWKDDKRWKGNGLIIFYDNNGQPTGEFFNGYMVNGKAAGHGILRLKDGSRFDGDFLEDRYYNGVLYNINNQIVDTYVNGISQRQKANDRNAAIAGTALGILRGFTGR